MIHSLRRIVLLALAVVLLTAAALPVLAQLPTPTPEPPNPNANISWPPPVYVLRGEFSIRGSANLPNMTNYFIEFRPLEDPFTGSEGTDVFFPAILPSSAAVQDDVLGVWDTELVPDGLYELRLTVNVRAGSPVFATVGPLRVENELPPFVEEPPVILPTQPPTPLPTETPPPTVDPTPRVTVTTQAGNVRAGDSTLFPIIATLSQGQTAQIVGISNLGTGWYQVRLPNGQIGWMAPSIVSVSGDLSLVPRVQPPPPPATPTPTPIPATPTPVTQANLVAGIVVLTPSQPVCNETFNVGFDVANLGTEPTISSGIVSLVDTRAADGSVQATTVGGFPVLQPGQTFRVDMPLTVSTWYNETHRITLTIDPQNLIPETQLGDNTRVIEYVLAQGGCP